MFARRLNCARPIVALPIPPVGAPRAILGAPVNPLNASLASSRDFFIFRFNLAFYIHEDAFFKPSAFLQRKYRGQRGVGMRELLNYR